MDQLKFAKDSLQKVWSDMVCLRQTISLQIFQRLSSANFNWSILKYFVPFPVIILLLFLGISNIYLKTSKGVKYLITYVWDSKQNKKWRNLKMCITTRRQPIWWYFHYCVSFPSTLCILLLHCLFVAVNKIMETLSWLTSTLIYLINS